MSTKMTPTQIAAAQAVLKQFCKNYGASASDVMLSNGVFSIVSAATGVGQPAQEYASAVSQATGSEITVTTAITINDDGSFNVTADNILNLPEGTYIKGESVEYDAVELEKMTKKDIIAMLTGVAAEPTPQTNTDPKPAATTTAQ